MTDRGLQAVVPVWGDRYVGAFLDLVLPSLLTPGNLCGLRRRDAFTLWVMTSAEDHERLSCAPAMRRAAEYVSVELIVRPERFPERMRHLNHFNRIYATGIERACQASRDLVMLCADAPLADGSLRTLERIWLEGRLCAFSASPRVEMEAFRLLAEEFRKPDGSLVLPPRDLVRLGMRTMHPWTRAYTFGPVLTRGSAGVYWSDGAGNLLITTLLMHPWFISTRAVPADFVSRSVCAIDGDVPDWLAGTDDEIFVLTDSDEFCAVECSYPLDLAPTETISGTMDTLVGEWAGSIAAYARRDLVPRPGLSRFMRLLDQRVHHHAGDPADIEPAMLAASGRFMTQVRSSLEAVPEMAG